MFDRASIRKQVIEWMASFIEVPHSQLGNWAPCPYARQARINDKIYIGFSGGIAIEFDVQEILPQLDTRYDVAILCYDHTEFTPDEYSSFVYKLNADIMSKGYVALEDHPDEPEYVNGVQMNFGHCALLLVQRLDKLNNAADQLREKGYYELWDKTAYDNVVSWRYK
jgi:hypothetical protein